MRRSYLGKLLLSWCDACNVPVLGAQCNCGSETRPVAITPPGDIRPAFPADIRLINRIFQDHFGSPLIPEGHLVLLNKIPDRDRMEEVIMGGAVVAAIRYLPGTERWEPLPRLAASRYLKPRRRYVVVDVGAIDAIRGGSSVLAPGLVAIDSSVCTGDEVIILEPSGEWVGVGRARVDAEIAGTLKRGAVVRSRKNVQTICHPGTAEWRDAVAANSAILARIESEAIRFVCSVRKQHPIPVNVSYSGGKDSLATLLIVQKALGSIPLLFADTGKEFAETYENVDCVAERYGLEVIRTSPGSAFCRTFEEEGPPSVDARWCCTVLKLGPLKNVIAERWGECLSFIGQRKYESFARKRSPRTWRNANLPNQVSAAPIQHWTALHVWLYLFRENAPYNPLYEQRIDRIGCFMCPSSDLATFAIIREKYPEMWDDWNATLRAWQKQHDLPEDWVVGGQWRRRGACSDTACGNR